MVLHTHCGTGFFYFFGLVGPTIGWLAGHWLHDAFGRWYASRHNGRIDAEARLVIAYPATVLSGLGLLIIGFALQNHWHYMVLAVFAATQACGILIMTTALNAYLLDAYPEGSAEVGTWLVLSRVCGGFMATYIQLPWVDEIGAAKVFGIQTGISAASAFIIVFLQVFGRRIRQKQGRMQFGRGIRK